MFSAMHLAIHCVSFLTQSQFNEPASHDVAFLFYSYWLILWFTFMGFSFYKIIFLSPWSGSVSYFSSIFLSKMNFCWPCLVFPLFSPLCIVLLPFLHVQMDGSRSLTRSSTMVNRVSFLCPAVLFLPLLLSHLLLCLTNTTMILNTATSNL